MRIIHTADWHLGQNFMGKSREPEHRAFLEWLVHLIKHERINALIVAGDIFDTGTPPSYARQLYAEFLVNILNADCQMIVVGGNHDSVAMLEESSSLLNHIGVRQIARPTDNPADQVVPLTLSGNTAQPGALVCAIPFLRPRDIVKSVAGQDSAEKQQQLQNAIANHYKDVYDAAVKLRAENDWHCPIIATGHLTAVGASRSDSVRDIYIGTLEAFSADAFPPADYIALGHIHGAQKVAGSETIRYSGSPIPLSFDESGKGRQKSLMQLTVKADAKIELATIDIPEFRSLQVIRGSLDSIEKQLQDPAIEPASADGRTTWLEVIVEMQDYLNDLQQRIALLLEGRNAEVLLVRRQRQQRSLSRDTEQQQTLDELTVSDIFEYRLQEEFGAEQSTDDAGDHKPDKALQERLKLLYQQVVSEVQSGDAT